MSTETPPPFPSSTVVLRICILIKDVIESLTSNQESFLRHQDVVRELLSLDRALLQVELFSEADVVFILKDKSASTIEQSRCCIVAFLEKCKLDPIFNIVDNSSLYATMGSEENEIEDFRSAINRFHTDLNKFVIESRCVFSIIISVSMLTTFHDRSSVLDSLESSTEGPSPENLRDCLSSTPSFTLEDAAEPEDIRLAQLLTDDITLGNIQHSETATGDHNPYNTVNKNTSLGGSASPEGIWNPFPPISFSDDEENDAPQQTNEHQSRRPNKRKKANNAARNHSLYENVTTDTDGLYHCPWEGKDPLCDHKPHKHKCIYEYEHFALPPPPLIKSCH